MKDGREYALVPHSLDSTKVLRNLGFNVEPPIMANYDWANTTPFDAQKVTAALITMNPRSFVLNDLGTGKTRAVLFAYDYLRREQQVKSCVVVAPLSTLRATWAKEVMMVFPHLSYRVLYGDRKKREKLLDEPADVYIVNHDGVEILLAKLAKRAEQDLHMLVLDELTAYKEPGTDRWKATNHLARKMRYVVGMTGSPIPNGPTDAYGQVKIVNPARMTMSFRQFRDHTMLKLSEFKYIPKRESTERVFELMQPGIRFTRDDCYDLPPCQTMTMHAPLTPQQEKIYRPVSQECAADVAAGRIKAVNEADRLNKLMQISLGTVYTTEHEIEVLDCQPRLQVVADAISQSNSKVIVFSPYKASVDLLEKFLQKAWTVAKVTGDTTSAQRDRIFAEFMNTQNPHVLVAHPQCMSHGLTLTAASTIIWYGPPASLETYEQANARITRPGQKHSQLIVNIAATRLEERVYQRLNARAATQGLLLEMFENQELEAIL